MYFDADKFEPVFSYPEFRDHFYNPNYVTVNSDEIKWYEPHSFNSDDDKIITDYNNSTERMIEMVNNRTKERLLTANKLLVNYQKKYKDFTNQMVLETVREVLSILYDIHPFFEYSTINPLVGYETTYGKIYLEHQLLYEWKKKKVDDAINYSNDNYFKVFKDELREYYKPIMDVIYKFEDDNAFEVAFDIIFESFFKNGTYKFSPLENLNYCIDWFRANLSIIANPIYKKHTSSFRFLIEFYLDGLPDGHKADIITLHSQDDNNLLTQELRKSIYSICHNPQIYGKYSQIDNIEQKQIRNLFSEITVVYNKKNIESKHTYQIRSFEELMFIYLKWIYENNINVNACEYCSRLFLSTSVKQKVCHYPKLDNMEKRCDELNSNERYRESLKIPIKDTIRKIQKRFDSRIKYDKQQCSKWYDAREEFAAELKKMSIIKDDYYDTEQQKKIEELYRKIVEEYKKQGKK